MTGTSATGLALHEAETDDDIAACWPLMRLLRPHLSTSATFVAQVTRQRTESYRLLMACQNGDPVALAGWRIQENLVHGRHVYVDDLVTGPEHRGRGLGARLLAAVSARGQELSCAKILLDTAVDNLSAQRFYAREGLDNTALRFSAVLPVK